MARTRPHVPKTSEYRRVGGSIHAIIVIVTTEYNEYNGGGLIDMCRLAENYEGVDWKPWKILQCSTRYMVQREFRTTKLRLWNGCSIENDGPISV